MSRVSWHIFKNRQPGAHLVAAVMANPTAVGLGPKYVQLVLERLVRSLKPASYYSTTVVRETGWPEVHSDSAMVAALAATSPVSKMRPKPPPVGPGRHIRRGAKSSDHTLRMI
jgi:hypothetical protein